MVIRLAIDDMARSYSQQLTLLINFLMKEGFTAYCVVDDQPVENPKRKV
jgi:hypothetical protein